MKNLKRLYSILLTFVLLMGVSIPAMAADTGFNDVPAGAEYVQAVAWCQENGLMAGVGGGRFSPDGTLTRAMLATVLYWAAGEPAVTAAPAFQDVEAGAWYSNAVVWASETGILLGYGGNRFGTNDPVTVEQLEVVIGRYIGTNPTWVGDPAKNIPATRAQIAVALYQNRALSTPGQDTAVNSTKFNLEKGTVLLNNGIPMPILGIGTYRLSDQQAEDSVYWALRDGYRLIDTARIYGNEAGVGRGIRRAIDEGLVTREDIFVTTKMWTSDYGNGAAAIDASLRRLGLDYIDLMILHHSQPSNDVVAYQAMEQAVEDGKLRSIGLSNYYTGSNYVSDTTSATSVLTMRQASKNILYTVVNSRAYAPENLNPGMPGWQKLAIGIDVVLAAAFLGLEFLAIRSYKKKKG